MNLICYLSNFLALGIDTTDTDTGGWVRNKICLSVSGLTIELHQEPELINAKKSELKGEFVESTKLVVKDIKEEDIDYVTGVVHKISNLLSFAVCSEVSFYAWNIEGTNRSRVWSVRGAYNYFRPPFCCVDTSGIQRLVECSFETYSELYEERALNVVVDLLNTPEVKNLQLELKLATLFVLLENLKSTYAKSKGYKYKNGFYFSPSNKKYVFITLLQEMFESVNMEVDLKEIKNLRNEIIHSGLSHLSHHEQLSIYGTCRDMVTEYFLRLIGYKDGFDTYVSRCMQSKLTN
ncbi:hypothetical protein CWO33_23445 [Vibrio splendidus]|uniref:hypothetical protein n=1 Tax=Vibrio splendidus TaxID=29497 RepID=UPI000D338FA3|nr:hypothetical protein [Vibrio splendidus]PTQ05439.1 hypothetical protein CWO33_23445 [Vibrio splendidus]